jgi:hypothetical protein
MAGIIAILRIIRTKLLKIGADPGDCRGKAHVVRCSSFGARVTRILTSLLFQRTGAARAMR